MDRRSDRKPKEAEITGLEELPDEALDQVRGGAAVPFHRVVNNTIYGGTTPTGSGLQKESGPDEALLER